jgi:RNA polymerase sigma factor (TIGR02999 family)
MESNQDITVLLREACQGDQDAYGKVFSLIYAELRTIARHIRRKFYGNETLNTTAIVHEAYLKLVGLETDWSSRNHFYGVAGKAMRHILLNAASKKKTEKRGGDLEKEQLIEGETEVALSEETSEQVLKLEDALQKLEKIDEQQARIVECRFYAGMSVEETASALNVSTATVKRRWSTTKVWLYGMMNSQLPIQA